jgi:hypothetical protein
MTLNAIFHEKGAGLNTLAFTAPKGSRCLCNKRAKVTLMADGERALAPLCMRCGLVVLECLNRSRVDILHRTDLEPKLREFIIQDSGISSLTIISVLVPDFHGMCLSRFSGVIGPTPCDPGDFGRCYRALKLIENGVERLGEVAAKYRNWKRLVEHWAELSELYEQELKSGKAPKLFKRMKELGL